LLEYPLLFPLGKKQTAGEEGRMADATSEHLFEPCPTSPEIHCVWCGVAEAAHPDDGALDRSLEASSRAQL